MFFQQIRFFLKIINGFAELSVLAADLIEINICSYVLEQIKSANNREHDKNQEENKTDYPAEDR